MARWQLLTLVYVLHVALAVALIDPVTQWVDDTLPGWFFYHLQPDEASGPIGDPLKALFMVAGLPLGFYAALFLPVGMRMRVSGWTLGLLACVDVPVAATLLFLWRVRLLQHA